MNFEESIRAIIEERIERDKEEIIEKIIEIRIEESK